MTILAIDTSTTLGSVALLVDGELRLDETFSADRSHTASLFTVLERARALVEKIDVVAVGLGPGSYAGIRIAISAAIGFQIGIGARIVGLPSVAALDTAETRYCAIGDARRETFYFARVEDGCCTDGPRLVNDAELRALLTEFRDWPIMVSAPIAAVPGAAIVPPLACRLARLAAAGQSIIMEETLEPLYLREPHITQPKVRPAR
ncbi:MAG: tRNA (adenosine(37)-N6)-threonylcarbamoyltransferase complex dimerization subunit type 1 TsaB [Chthoniobacteraceae bacterium]